MDTKKYKILEKVVDLGSLTRAADDLRITQSGVSHVLLDLEKELGFPILLRSRNGSKLTTEGERVMPLIRSILRSEEQLEQTAADIRGVSQGTLRIGTFSSVAVHWLPGMIKDFQSIHPQVDFRLFNGDYHDIDRWLSDGSIDLGFVIDFVGKNYEWIPLREDRLLAILPQGHTLANQDICSVQQVAEEPFISLLESSDHDARFAMERAGVKPNTRFTTKDDYAIIAMVRQGLGVSIMPELLLRGHDHDIAVRPLDPPANRMIGLALPTSGKIGPATRRFAEFAVQWVKEQHG